MDRLPQAALLTGFFLITSCSLPSGWLHSKDKAEVSLPKVWASASKGQHAKISSGWLEEFNDPKMTALVHEAIRKNHNLTAAAHRLRATRESTIISRAARLPSVNAGASTSRSYAGLGPAPGRSSHSYGLSFSASWEPDLWGRLRDLDRATNADYEASLADHRAARLSLAVNTSRAWVNLVEAQQQLELSEGTLSDFEKSLSLISRRYKASLLRAVDVQLGRNNVANAKRNVINRTLQRNEAARSLQVLLGRYPSGELKASNKAPALSPEIPAGLPSDLLNRRPDLVSSQLRLYSSARRADAAQKDLLPSLRLTGSSGTGSSELRQALDPGFLTWSIASSLAQTVYRGGAPTASARAALERNRAEIHNHVQNVLLAFREVESALQIDRSLREQEVHLLVEVRQAGLAQTASERDLGLGLEGASVLQILEAQRRAVNARAGLIRLRNQRLLNRLDLHLALGGDFETVSTE